jgi:hypothetical protein
VNARAYEAPPPGANAWWLATYGDSTAHIFTRTWFDARTEACSCLGCCQDAIVVTLGKQERTERDADV